MNASSSQTPAVLTLNEPKQPAAEPNSLVESPTALGGGYSSLSLCDVVSVTVKDPVFCDHPKRDIGAYCIQRIELRMADGGAFSISLERVIAERPKCARNGCRLPEGSTCPDCGPSCHEVGEGD